MTMKRDELKVGALVSTDQLCKPEKAWKVRKVWWDEGRQLDWVNLEHPDGGGFQTHGSTMIFRDYYLIEAVPFVEKLLTKEEASPKERIIPGQIRSLEPVRRRLPNTRPSITHKREICGSEYYVTVGFYDDPRDGKRDHPAEIFIVCDKHGSVVSGLLDGLCTTMSVAMQYGVPWETIRGKFKGSRFGTTGYFEGKEQTSILDGLADVVDYIVAERAKVTGEDDPEALEKFRYETGLDAMNSKIVVKDDLTPAVEPILSKIENIQEASERQAVRCDIKAGTFKGHEVYVCTRLDSCYFTMLGSKWFAENDLSARVKEFEARLTKAWELVRVDKMETSGSGIGIAYPPICVPPVPDPAPVVPPPTHYVLWLGQNPTKEQATEATDGPTSNPSLADVPQVPIPPAPAAPEHFFLGTFLGVPIYSKKESDVRELELYWRRQGTSGGLGLLDDKIEKLKKWVLELKEHDRKFPSPAGAPLHLVINSLDSL